MAKVWCRLEKWLNQRLRHRDILRTGRGDIRGIGGLKAPAFVTQSGDGMRFGKVWLGYALSIFVIATSLMSCVTPAEQVGHLVKYSSEADLRRELVNVIDGHSDDCTGTVVPEDCVERAEQHYRLLRAAIKIKHEQNIANAPECVKGYRPSPDLFSGDDPNAVVESFATGRLVRYGPDDCNKQVCAWRRSMYPLGPKDCIS
jgi:hypothetical protein